MIVSALETQINTVLSSLVYPSTSTKVFRNVISPDVILKSPDPMAFMKEHPAGSGDIVGWNWDFVTNEITREDVHNDINHEKIAVFMNVLSKSKKQAFKVISQNLIPAINQLEITVDATARLIPTTPLYKSGSVLIVAENADGCLMQCMFIIEGDLNCE